jgi:hypothetical protein
MTIMTDTTAVSRIDARTRQQDSERVQNCMRPPPAKPLPSLPPPPKV